MTPGSTLTLTPPLRKNDELLLRALEGDVPLVKAYEQETIEVVHGPSCVPEREIDCGRCAHDGVPVVARRGGGGTVVLAPGMLVVVVVAPRPAGDVRAIYAWVHRAMIGVLRSAGIELVERGTSDLACGNRKVAGSSLYVPRAPRVFFYQASLMVDCELGLLDRYLLHPPREPAYRAGRSHREFCTTLRAEGVRQTAREIGALLERHLPAGLGPGA